MDLNSKVVYKAPVEFYNQSIEKVRSSDADIKAKKQVWVIPREGGMFGRQSNAPFSDTLNERTRFYLSDSSHYLDMMNSYITCDFTASTLSSADAALSSFLDEGGIHSLINRITVKIGGAELEHISDYGKWYNACVNFPKHSPDFRNLVLASAGDSMNDVYEVPQKEYSNVTFTNTTFTLSTGVLTLTGGKALTELKVGDELIITVKYVHNASADNIVESKVQVVRVLSITSDISIVVEGGKADIAENTVSNIQKVNNIPLSTRKFLCDGAQHKLAFSLPLGSLQLMEFFPLPLIKNFGPLEIEIEWNSAIQSLVLQKSSDAAAGNKIGYKIENPRFVASMIAPGEIAEGHQALYNDMGLVFTYKGWRHFQNGINSGSESAVFNIQTNLKSIKSIVSVITDRATADNDSDATQSYKSNSSFLRSNLNAYRYFSGALRFPEYSEVDLSTDPLGSQAMAQYLLAMDMYDSRLDSPTSIRPYEWRGLDATKFVAAVSTSKYNDFYSGLDSSNDFIEAEFRFNSALSSNVNVHTWLSYDTMLVLSKDGIRVVR